MNLHRTTVVRKFRFLAEQARLAQQEYLLRFKGRPLNEVIFDEMETFEHTKYKPLSIALAVSSRREILAVHVAQMPAKGLLVDKARKKYGYRRDHRPQALKRMLEELLPIVEPTAVFKSDESPRYPGALKHVFPRATHVTTKGGRSAIVGQGELKKLAWDPIFALNHTAAMMRANLNRLFRRTWCTTKTIQGLSDHLALYCAFHNRFTISF